MTRASRSSRSEWAQPRASTRQTDKIDDPLLQLMERLRTQNQFDVIKAARFAYRGE